MPHQNRVTPHSTIIATPARGTLMGNRGILHDDHKTITRNHGGKRWIICLTEFKNRNQAIMSPGHYTQLFFLDEATALAAGHRPCAECQRERFTAFRNHWAAANPEQASSRHVSADTVDAALHAERVVGDRRNGWRKVTYAAQIRSLCDGVFVLLADDPTPYLIFQHRLYPWSADGYGESHTADRDGIAQVLTPRSVVNTLRHGYQPDIHPLLQRR